MVIQKSILKMKQQTYDKLNVWRTRKKSEPYLSSSNPGGKMRDPGNGVDFLEVERGPWERGCD